VAATRSASSVARWASSERRAAGAAIVVALCPLRAVRPVIAAVTPPPQRRASALAARLMSIAVHIRVFGTAAVTRSSGDAKGAKVQVAPGGIFMLPSLAVPAAEPTRLREK
jgi:hypothetical protein